MLVHRAFLTLAVSSQAFARIHERYDAPAAEREFAYIRNALVSWTSRPSWVGSGPVRRQLENEKSFEIDSKLPNWVGRLPVKLFTPR